MNFTMPNHAHACTTPAYIGEPKSKKVDFVTPNFSTLEISKAINMVSEHGTTNVITRYKNEMVHILIDINEQNGTYKIPQFTIRNIG